MARPIYITEELISSTANRLLEQGTPLVEITNSLIRKELGKGSLEDIQPLLRAWKTKQVADKGLGVDIPDVFKGELAEFGSKLWRLAASISAEKNSAMYEDYKRLECEVKDNHSLFTEVENERSDLKDSLSALYHQLLSLKEDVACNKQELKVFA